MNIRLPIHALLLFIHIKYGNSVADDGSDTISSQVNIVEKNLKYWTNPCTGSISNDVGNEEDLDCMKPAIKLPIDPIVTIAPTKAPTNQPTERPSSPPSSLPTDAPSPSPSEDTKIYQCPISECSTEEFMDEAITIKFKYKIETSSDVTDPSYLLPKVESALLEELADKVLSHCLRRKLFQIPAERKLRRRHLQTVDETGATGVCSLPEDTISSDDSCTPETGDQCHVVEGGVSVTIGDDDTAAEIISTILNITEGAMKNDTLLSTDTPELEKVTFIGIDEDDEDDDDDEEDEEGEGKDVIVPVGISEPQSAQKDSITEILIIGGSFAALASIMALLIMGKKRRKDEDKMDDESPFGMVEFPGVANNESYIAPDGMNLAKIATCMDVHHCKSQTCAKCYTGPPIQFVSTPLNANGEFAKSNVDAVPTRTFTNESGDDNDEELSHEGSAGSWTTVSFPRLAWW